MDVCFGPFNSFSMINVQVQHIHLTDTAVADIVTVDFLVNFLHRCFPAFDYRYFVRCLLVNPKNILFQMILVSVIVWCMCKYTGGLS